jgi:hypothetical protein
MSFRFARGFSIKIHLYTNPKGLLIGTTITAGEAHDIKGYGSLVDKSDFD